MPKNKTHKGLLKRIRVTGTGKIRLNRAAGRHLRSHKTGQLLRKYRQPKYASGPDARRLRSVLGLAPPDRRPEPAKGQATTESRE